MLHNYQLYPTTCWQELIYPCCWELIIMIMTLNYKQHYGRYMKDNNGIHNASHLNGNVGNYHYKQQL